jgi:hypothetical protein
LLSPRSFSIASLLFLGFLFAAGNLWFAASRSAIPLKLHGTVRQTQRLIEKTPGVDDVCLVTLDSGRPFQLDLPVFEAVREGQSLNKPAWARTLDVDGRPVALSWSRDFRGMAWAMPLTVLICVAVGRMAGRHYATRLETAGSKN